jgi:hypothetical protein
MAGRAVFLICGEVKDASYQKRQPAGTRPGRFHHLSLS